MLAARFVCRLPALVGEKRHQPLVTPHLPLLQVLRRQKGPPLRFYHIHHLARPIHAPLHIGDGREARGGSKAPLESAFGEL